MCEHCGGSGWIVIEKRGISAAERCACSTASTPKLLSAPNGAISLKPSAKEYAEVLKRFAKVIPYFPQTAEAWALIQEDMERYVSNSDVLELFRERVITFCIGYEGPAGLRRIYCAFWTPADGVYPLEALAGVNAADQVEAAYRAREMEENERRMAEYRRRWLALMPAERAEPLLLEGVVSQAKSLPAATPAPFLRRSIENQPVYSYNTLVEAAHTARSLEEREKDLIEAMRATPKRSEEENARLVREVEERLRAKLANPAQTAQGGAESDMVI
jgi:hypothetical protein